MHEGMQILAGNQAMLQENQIEISEQDREQMIWFAEDGKQSLLFAIKEAVNNQGYLTGILQ